MILLPFPYLVYVIIVLIYSDIENVRISEYNDMYENPYMGVRKCKV